MTLPKTWPSSGSEFILNEMQIRILQEHTRGCFEPFCPYRLSLTQHELARDVNEVHLKLLAERYYTAAGFRT